MLHTNWNAIKCDGFNMLSDHWPDRSKGLITEQIKDGVRDEPLQGKAVVIKPHAEVQWTPGRHFMFTNGAEYPAWVACNVGLKLLHYRYMDEQYVDWKHKMHWTRMTEQNIKLKHAIHCFPDWQGYLSLQWYRNAFARKGPVI
jgi:hypothetical protein